MNLTDVDIEVDFTQPENTGKLLVGYSADVEVEIARRTNVLRLPAEACREDGQVLRLRDGHLELVRPEFGLENWNWLEIRSGLSEGDQLVQQPGQLIVDPKKSYRTATAQEQESAS